jgi:DNA-directed RNA polymerase specialized sigma24 family protein
MRLAVTLRIVEDLSYEEVAARLAAPVPRVRTWVSRGLDRLRRTLETRDDRR